MIDDDGKHDLIMTMTMTEDVMVIVMVIVNLYKPLPHFLRIHPFLSHNQFALF